MPGRDARRARRRLLAAAPRGAPARHRGRRRRDHRRCTSWRPGSPPARRRVCASHRSDATCTRRGRASSRAATPRRQWSARYQRFLALNRELIRVCNDWQVRPGGAPNDHSDPTYDWSVVDRLVAIDERVGPILRTASQQCRALRWVPAPAPARPPARERRRVRLVHVTAHRLVPHGVDAAPRRLTPRARSRRESEAE